MQKKKNKVVVKPSTATNQKPVVQAAVPVATTVTATAKPVAKDAPTAENNSSNTKPVVAPANNSAVAVLPATITAATPSTNNAANTKSHTTTTPDKATAVKVAVASPEKTVSKAVANVTKSTKTNKTTKTAVPVVSDVAIKAKKEKAVVTPKAEKPKKPKLIRDSFTFPKDEYEQLASLKERVLKMGVASKKTEILRAAIQNLSLLSDEQLLVAINKVPNIKTGRPAA
jgi:hypothetical protein